MSDITLQGALSTLIAAMVVGYGLALVVRWLRRSHPGLALELPLAVGAAARLVSVVVVDATGLSRTLRGGDETTFLENATGLSAFPLSAPDWTSTLTGDLHTAVFAIQIKLFAFGEGAMRMTQLGIALLGLLLLIAAIHEVGGPRASRLGAWLVLLEPAGVFFDSSLHKEPVIQLAVGVAAYGTVKLWRDLDSRGIAVAAAGCAIAVCTRVYAGWFLVSGCVLVAFHGAWRRLDRLRAMPLIAAVIVAVFLATPTLLQLSSPEGLERLQKSQDYTTTYDPALRSDIAEATSTDGNNLALERVDFSTREKLVVNLPRRMRDVVFRPYPWQIENTSQVLGAIGGLIALAVLGLTLRYAWLARGRVLALTAPFLYPMLFLLVASALSAGNAGTSFRYRTHVVSLALAMLAVLVASVAPERAALRWRPRRETASKGGATTPQPVT